jgi:hypothetical protein
MKTDAFGETMGSPIPMKDPGDDRREHSSRSLGEGLRESLPLLVTSIVLLAAAVLAGARGIVVGSAKYPLAGLLATLGFVAAIGSVLSWFFAGGSTRRPERHEASGQPPLRVDVPRTEGRPRPNVRAGPVAASQSPPPAPAPWDEGLVDLPVPGPFSGSSNARQTESQLAIQEINGIQHDVTSRRARRPDDRP